jgi:hypothetical protein
MSVFPQSKRFEVIKSHIGKYTQREIADKCNVNVRTIERDVRQLKESGEWFQWIEEEFLRLHREGEVPDTKKYDKMADLYKRTLVTKSESKVEAKGEIVVKAYDLGNKR